MFGVIDTLWLLIGSILCTCTCLSIYALYVRYFHFSPVLVVRGLYNQHNDNKTELFLLQGITGLCQKKENFPLHEKY